MSEHAAAATTGLAAIVDYLDGQKVAYEVVEHEPTMTAAAEAQATHRPKHQVAKTVVLQDARGGYVLAIVPASDRLDLRKLRDALDGVVLRLASEDEMAADLPMVEVGATPPVGPMLPRLEVLDARLYEEDRILCAAGDHRHSVLLDPRDVAKLAGAKIADVCED
jgi:Ala-tRNA(Pro) deacylase